MYRKFTLYNGRHHKVVIGFRLLGNRDSVTVAFSETI